MLRAEEREKGQARKNVQSRLKGRGWIWKWGPPKVGQLEGDSKRGTRVSHFTLQALTHFCTIDAVYEYLSLPVLYRIIERGGWTLDKIENQGYSQEHSWDLSWYEKASFPSGSPSIEESPQLPKTLNKPNQPTNLSASKAQWVRFCPLVSLGRCRRFFWLEFKDMTITSSWSENPAFVLSFITWVSVGDRGQRTKIIIQTSIHRVRN